MRAVGIDVGVRFQDAVLLVDGLRCDPPRRLAAAADVTDLLREWRPDVVGIDSPPRFGVTGGSRLAERELHRRGIPIFFCPSEERAAGNRFYDWMSVGFRVFDAAADAGYPLSTDAGDVAHRSLEVFPHATAVVLRGARPPLGCTRRMRTKREWRSRVLTDAGVDVAPLRSVHDVDAALAALTAARALDGEATALGDPNDGVVFVPVRELRDRYEREVIAG